MQIKNISQLTLLIAYLLLLACATSGTEGTLASLNDVKFVVKQEKVEDSLEKALQSYQKYLEETPETEMTPEALRRLADLKIQKVYEAEETIETTPQAPVVLPAATDVAVVANSASQATDIQAPDTSFVATVADRNKESNTAKDSPIADIRESEKAFSKRAVKKIELGKARDNKIITPDKAGKDADDLQSAGAKEAIELYQGLLKKYPLFERNDQVFYQLSRAYEETGQLDIAMKTLEQLIQSYPQKYPFFSYGL